jgi:hypothetical protein
MNAIAQTSNLIDAVLVSVQKVGIAKTIYNLSMGLKKESLSKAVKAINDTNIVIHAVADKFDITADEILFGKGRKNERLHAIGFCAYYLHYIYKYEMDDVTVLLNKDISVCYKYSKIVIGLNPGHKSDQIYLGVKVELDNQLKKDSTALIKS